MSLRVFALTKGAYVADINIRWLRFMQQFTDSTTQVEDHQTACSLGSISTRKSSFRDLHLFTGSETAQVLPICLFGQ